jgi:feruloyl-CoA synthase
MGERIVMGTGLGMTESGPFGIFVTSPNVKAGDLGLPTPGLELKLVDTQCKTEVRYRGPNITPGYWRQPDETADAFDDEGFFKTGDAVKWIDETDVHQGLKFDGRIAEDFKLATGTFVSVGPLARQDHCGRRALHPGRGAHRPEHEGGRRHGVPHRPPCASSAGLPADASLHDVLDAPAVLAQFQQIVDALAQQRHRQRQPHRAPVPAGRRAHHRPWRNHRQRLDQPARRADRTAPTPWPSCTATVCASF